MRYEVLVPEPVRDEIASWGLPADTADELYARLQSDLEYGHEHTCFRLSAPTPTYVFKLSLEDPLLKGITHDVTFYLTYGPKDYALYVMSCQYTKTESWES